MGKGGKNTVLSLQFYLFIFVYMCVQIKLFKLDECYLTPDPFLFHSPIQRFGLVWRATVCFFFATRGIIRPGSPA